MRYLWKKIHKLKLSESQFKPIDGKQDEESPAGRNQGCASAPFPPDIAHLHWGAVVW